LDAGLLVQSAQTPSVLELQTVVYLPIPHDEEFLHGWHALLLL
jgi:hypothetical protein